MSRAGRARAEGWPIAAHLAALAALAAAAAFVAALATIVLLPPRPPGLMRGDQIAAAFVAGYQETLRSGGAPSRGRMRWRIDEGPAGPTPGRAGGQLSREIARRLALAHGSVRVSGRPASHDMFVFSVREVRRVEPLPPHAPPPPPPPPPVGAASAPADPPLFLPAPPGVVLLSAFKVSGRLPDGRWLIMSQGRNWDELGWIARAALAVAVALLAMAPAVWLVSRRIARPIQAFAAAVEAVGVDPRSEPVAP